MSKLWKHLSSIATTVLAGDLIVKHIDVLSERLDALNRQLDALSRRLDIVNGRLDSHARPRCGGWLGPEWFAYVVDERGVTIGSYGRTMQEDVETWTLFAARPFETPFSETLTGIDDATAKARVLDVLRPWCDVSAAESEAA